MGAAAAAATPFIQNAGATAVAPTALSYSPVESGLGAMGGAVLPLLVLPPVSLTGAGTAWPSALHSMVEERRWMKTFSGLFFSLPARFLSILGTFFKVSQHTDSCRAACWVAAGLVAACCSLIARIDSCASCLEENSDVLLKEIVRARVFLKRSYVRSLLRGTWKFSRSGRRKNDDVLHLSTAYIDACSQRSGRGTGGAFFDIGTELHFI